MHLPGEAVEGRSGISAAGKPVENRIQDWVVEEPLHGFLFPAFNDRQTDIHGMLYSARKAEELQPDFMESMSVVRCSCLREARRMHSIR